MGWAPNTWSGWAPVSWEGLGVAVGPGSIEVVVYRMIIDVTLEDAMPLLGETVKMAVQFKDFEGANAQPTDPTFAVYRRGRVVLEAAASMGEGDGDGGFEVAYTIPADLPEAVDELIAEFRGEVDGAVALHRVKVPVSFA